MKRHLKKAAERLPEKGSLTRRMMSASGYSALGTAGQAVLRLGSNLITTRLLFPEAFGLIAIVVTIQSLCMLVTDVGISRSIVRDKDGEDPRYLQVAWTMQTIVLIVVGLLMVAAAGVVAIVGPLVSTPDSVFADPTLPALIAFCALTPIASIGLTPARVVASRRLQEGRIALFTILSQLIGTIIVIATLYVVPSVWVLAMGLIVQALIRSVMSRIMFPYPGLRMWPLFDREIIQRQWQFGRFVLLTSPLQFFFRQGDRLMLGALLDARTFGFYVIAMVWVEAVRTAAEKIMNSVGYAGVAEVVRDRPERLPIVYPKYQAAMAILFVGAALAVVVIGPPVIRALYEEEYAPVADFLVLLGLMLAFVRFYAVGTVKLAQGRSDQSMFLALTRALGMLLSVPVGFHLGGTTGAVVGAVLAGAWSVPIAFYYTLSFMPAGYVWRDAVFFLLAISIVFTVGSYVSLP